jgi:WD40 repeat protein
MRAAAGLCVLLTLTAGRGAAEPKLVATLKGHKEDINGLAFYPDGKTLVTAGRDGTVRLWDVTTGKEGKTLRKQDRGFTALVLSEDGTVLAVSDGSKEIRLWPKKDGDSVILNAEFAVVAGLAVSPDGATLAAGTSRGELFVWDVATQKLINRINPGGSRIENVRFSPEGKMVFAEETGTIHLYGARGRGKELDKLTVGTSVRALAVAPDGKGIAVSRIHAGVGLCYLKAERFRELSDPQADPVYALAFSPNGKLLAGATYYRTKEREPEGRVIVWDVAARKEYCVLTGLPTDSRALAFSPNGKLLAAGSGEGPVKVWQLPPEVIGGGPLGFIARLGAPTGLRCTALRPDGKELAAGGDDGSVFVWQVGKEAPRLTLKGHTRAVLAIAYAPDGKSLLTAGLDGTPRLWDPATGKERAALAGHKSPLLTVAFAPDGKAMATGDSAGFVRLLDGDGTERRALKAHKGAVNGLAFTPDGKRLLTAGSDGVVRKWDATGEGEPVERLKLEAGVGALALAPDGKALYLADRDGWLTCLELAEGKSRRVLARPLEMVQALAVSADGKTLAVSGRLDEDVGLYAAADGKELAVIDWHTDWVSGVAFSADGKLLATASMDGSVRLWRPPAPPEK